MVPRAIPVNSALRSRAQSQKECAWVSWIRPEGKLCQVVLMHCHSSAGMTSRARRALSRASAQDAEIELVSRLS